MFYLYGITEVSCWASFHEAGPGDDGSNLGVPLSETLLQVRGDDDKEVTEGVGEMFIGNNYVFLSFLDDVSISLKCKN